MSSHNYDIRLCSLACLFVLFSGSVQGQASDDSKGILPSTPLENCSVDQWTGDNGLLSNNLTSVIQAESGFLWITTNNGLMRFDGVRLEIFDQDLISFLSTDAFYRVYEDKNNVLWFASRGSGIVKYRDHKFEQHLADKDIPKSPRTMLIQNDGTIWVGSDNRGLFKIKDTTVTQIRDPLLEDIIVMHLEEGENGKIYIGTNTRGLLEYHDDVITRVSLGNDFNNTAVMAIKYVSDGALYVGTSEGLLAVENGNVREIDFLKDIQVNHIVADHYGSVWIGTERGLGRITTTGKEEFLRVGRGFSGSHITSLFLDKEGSLWMSTAKSGLLRMKESPIRNYNEQHGLSVDPVNMVVEGPDGKFYIGLDDGLVDVMSDGKFRPFAVKHPALNESVRDIFVEENGTCWIACYNGVIKKQGKKEILISTETGLPSNSVRRIFRDSKKRFWLGTRTGGVVLLDGEKVKHIYNRENGFGSDYILAIEEDKNGRIFVGTHSGGLNIINSDGSFEIIHLQDDDDGVLIFNVHIDSDNKIWLATSIGLYSFDTDSRKFTRLALADVVKGESYFDWVEDNVGNIWIPTNIGIVSLSKNDVLQFLTGKIPRIKSKIYNDYDGMKNKECTGATRSTLSSTGEVWVPTIEGICIINPEHKGKNKIVPRVYITALITDHQGVIAHPTDGLKLEPGNVRISIQFTSLSLVAPNKVKFKYRLDNVDAAWNEDSSQKRNVDYTNLSPGNYTFFVTASNNDEIWNEEGAKLSFKVLPFYYQTVWFYILMAILFLFIFFVVYKWRVNAVERKNAELVKVNSELDRFVYSASHDLRAPLASILGLVKLTRMDSNHENQQQYLEMVERSIHKLDGFIHDIINYSRNARTEIQASEIKFEVVVQEIIDALKYQENSPQIRKEIYVQGSGLFFSDRKRVDIILFNLISNAIKYHRLNQEDPYIRVSVMFTTKQTIIEVSDNGLGIEQAHLENIFKMFYRADERSSGSGLGLFIARETVEKINGTLSVMSTYGKGSVFRIQIPSLA
jgi:signal transduction histidine kinase/ligand-binding sensor domain-containing protein